MASNDQEGIHIQDQVRDQTGGQQVRLRIDERNMKTGYANAFRTNGTADEVIVDFGLNTVSQPQQQGDSKVAGEILFQVNDRLIMNYYSAKRLAIALGQLIRRHEEQFGELKLNVADRVKK